MIITLNGLDRRRNNCKENLPKQKAFEKSRVKVTCLA